ncbi:MAG: hypothetical protein B6U85_05610 [Desulfurococcales archaeon ex4484_42]|nr:MAG: hypothetical protein B6U85_05610 [Desulfurococcales archaeon ex4484_42]
MAVRVKLRIRSRVTSRSIEASALVNSGYETIKPQLLVPVKVAELLGLWPSIPRHYIVREYMTAGGPIKNYVLEDEVYVNVIVEYNTEPVIADLVISTVEDEILISDKLAGRLGIIVYDFAEGVWKLRSDPENIKRKSEARQTW